MVGEMDEGNAGGDGTDRSPLPPLDDIVAESVSRPVAGSGSSWEQLLQLAVASQQSNSPADDTARPATTNDLVPGGTGFRAPSNTTSGTPGTIASEAPNGNALPASDSTATEAPNDTASEAPNGNALPASDSTATEAPNDTATEAPSDTESRERDPAAFGTSTNDRPGSELLARLVREADRDRGSRSPFESSPFADDGSADTQPSFAGGWGHGDSSNEAAAKGLSPSDETGDGTSQSTNEELGVDGEALRSLLVDQSAEEPEPEQRDGALARLGPLASKSARSFGSWIGNERANRRSARAAAQQQSAAQEAQQNLRALKGQTQQPLDAAGSPTSLGADTVVQEQQPDQIPWSDLNVWDRLNFDDGNDKKKKAKSGPGALRRIMTVLLGSAIFIAGAWLGLQLLANDNDLPGNEWAEEITEDPPFPLNVAAAVFGTPEAPIAPPATGPYVQLDWDGQQLVVGGLVPDVRLAEELLATAETSFEGANVVPEVVIDADLGSTPGWLAASPQAIPTLQLLRDVTLIIADGQILATGTARTADDIAFIDSLLVEATGMPVELRAVEISGRRAASWLIERSGNSVTITGALPSDELRQGFVAGAERLYTADNVRDFTNVDSEAETARWMYEPDRMFEAFYGFSGADLEFSGERYLFRLSGGPSFATGSAEISEQLAAALDYVAHIMNSEPTMSIQLAGHTDSTGSRQTNQVLSEARALAAANFLVRAGIDPQRVTSVGHGPDQPIDTNETDRGRERNRRIEMVMTRDPLGF